MVTTCLSCRQQLAVTAADLRVGQGYVRCGRCDKVFNALLTLAEDAPAPTEPESVARGTITVPALDEEDVLPPLPGQEDSIAFDPEDEVEVVQTHASGEYRSIVLEGADVGIEAGGDATADSGAARHLDEFDADAAVGNLPHTGKRWYVAAVLLALGLAGQYLHHNRHALVAMPRLEAPIQWLYGLFGRTVEPPWDLAGYEVSALGDPELTGDGRMVVLRAAVAVKKDAAWGQPPPLIRAVLSDRWGNEVATNTLAPQDWLLGEAPARIAPGQRLDARLSLPAPASATGFMLYPCLPDASGGVRCTDETVR